MREADGGATRLLLYSLVLTKQIRLHLQNNTHVTTSFSRTKMRANVCSHNMLEFNLSKSCAANAVLKSCPKERNKRDC